MNANLPDKAIKILNYPFINLELNDENKGPAKEELFYIERAFPNLFRFKANDLIKEYSQMSYPEKKEFVLIQGKKDDTISQKEASFIMNKYSPRALFFDGRHTIDLDSLKKVIFFERD